MNACYKWIFLIINAVNTGVYFTAIKVVFSTTHQFVLIFPITFSFLYRASHKNRSGAFEVNSLKKSFHNNPIYTLAKLNFIATIVIKWLIIKHLVAIHNCLHFHKCTNHMYTFNIK